MKRKLIALSISVAMAFTIMSVPAMAADVSDEVAAADTQAVAQESSVTVPETVQNIRTKTTYNSVTLTWDSIEGAAGYKIYRSDKEDGKFSKLAAVDSETTSFRDKGLNTGITVYYRITVIPADNVTLASGKDAAEVTTVKATPKLAKPVASGYAKSRITVQVNWKKVSGAGSYTIYKYNYTKKSYKKLKSFSSKTLSYTDKKQQAGTRYRYLVRAYRSNAGITTHTNSSAVVVKTPKILTMRTKGFYQTNSGKVILQARKKLGCPYVWGASGPNCFDCSGFTCYTMMQVGKKVTGVNLTRTSSRGLYARYNSKYGLGRNLKIAQPGDIIIMGYGGSRYSIFHVGMYYDRGQYIHATTGGRGVTISKIPASMVVAIIRLPGLE